MMLLLDLLKDNGRRSSRVPFANYFSSRMLAPPLRRLVEPAGPQAAFRSARLAFGGGIAAAAVLAQLDGVA